MPVPLLTPHRRIDVTNFDSESRVELLDGHDGSREWRSAKESADAWYRERKELYAKDYESAWYYAGKIAALIGIQLIALLRIFGVI